MIAAIVPACGRSQRMGRPKLVLPVDGVPLIERVVRVLLDGGAAPVVVVVPPIELQHGSNVAAHARSSGAFVAQLDQPTADMRETFQHGLSWLDAATRKPEGVFLAPADSPGLSATVVRQLVEFFRSERPCAVVPSFQGRRGHPLLLSWDQALRVRDLPGGVGVNALLHGNRDVQELAVDEAGVLADLDTPEDYTRWQSS